MEAGVVRAKVMPFLFPSEHPVRAAGPSPRTTVNQYPVTTGCRIHPAASCSSHRSSSNGQEKHQEGFNTQPQAPPKGLLFHPSFTAAVFQAGGGQGKAGAVDVLSPFFPRGE